MVVVIKGKTGQQRPDGVSQFGALAVCEIVVVLFQIHARKREAQIRPQVVVFNSERIEFKAGFNTVITFYYLILLVLLWI